MVTVFAALVPVFLLIVLGFVLKRSLLRLETNRNLTEAIAMYRAAGYAEVAAFNDEAYAHHWFEKQI